MGIYRWIFRWPVCSLLVSSLIACAGPAKREVYRKPKPEVSTQRPYVVFGKKYYPLKSTDGFEEKGLVSWYGSKWHGRKTSNGEIYNMYERTAAHKVLPMGTYVRVRNLKNHKETIVRINDRGPFVKGRIIDLSYASAKDIGIVGPGVAPVKIVALGKPVKYHRDGEVHTVYKQPQSYYVGDFTIQVGAFRDKKNAQKLRDKLSNKYKNAHITLFSRSTETFFRVRVAQYSDLRQAMEVRDKFIREGFADAFVVAR